MTDASQRRFGSEYQIRLKGVLDRKWADWFDGLTITTDEKGETLMVGLIADQTALHGLLSKIRDLGLVLLSVQMIEGTGKGNRSANSYFVTVR